MAWSKMLHQDPKLSQLSVRIGPWLNSTKITEYTPRHDGRKLGPASPLADKCRGCWLGIDRCCVQVLEDFSPAVRLERLGN